MNQMLGLNEYEFRAVLEMLADTEPHLEISENIINYLDGREQLSNATFNTIMKQKDNIIKFVQNFVREDIDKTKQL